MPDTARHWAGGRVGKINRIIRRREDKSFRLKNNQEVVLKFFPLIDDNVFSLGDEPL